MRLTIIPAALRAAASPSSDRPRPTMHRARREASPRREGAARVARRPLPATLNGTEGQSGPGEALPLSRAAIEKAAHYLTGEEAGARPGASRAGDGALFGRAAQASAPALSGLSGD